ncbi:MAG: SET domain-containing protein-lysine N-methyltransferase, partial [Chlamydiota bacterium]
MGIFSRGRNNPLHQAVIDNDISAAQNLSAHKELFFEANNMGFTAYELAQFLQKREILKIFNPKEHSIGIKILLPDEKEVKIFSEKDFLDSFGFRYLKTLHFANYKDLNGSINKFPWNYHSIFFNQDSHRLGRQYQDKLVEGDTADLSIRWIDNTLGYGVFADTSIDENNFVGEYTGLVRQLYRCSSDPNAYCFHYPTRFLSMKIYVVDALHEGNILRFVNHSDIPNLIPVCMVDRGLTHIAFMTTRRIQEGEQLTIDYGENYWKRRT